MKTSVRKQKNIAAVITIAIVMSLLASACGRGTTKTLRPRTGDTKATTDKTITPVNTISDEERIVEAIREKRELDKADKNIQVDEKAVLDLSKRLVFVQSSESDEQVEINARINRGDKSYFVHFEGSETTEDSTVFNYMSTVKEIVNEQISEKEVKLENVVFTAKIKKIDDDMMIISIIETLLNVGVDAKGKKTHKATEATVMLRINKAVTNVTSEDQNILKMKDAFVQTRISQVYISNDKIEAGEYIKVDSEANRIRITVDDVASKNRLFDLTSKLSMDKNDSSVKIEKQSKELESFKTENFESINLISGGPVLTSNDLSLIFKDKESKKESQVVMKLVSIFETDEKESKENEKQEVATEEQSEKSEDAAAAAQADAKAEAEAAPKASNSIDEDFYTDTLPAAEVSSAKPAVTAAKKTTATAIAAPKAKTQTSALSKTTKPATAKQSTVSTVLNNANTIRKGTGEVIVAAMPFTMAAKTISGATSAKSGQRLQGAINASKQAQLDVTDAANKVMKAASQNAAIASAAAGKTATAIVNLHVSAVKSAANLVAPKAKAKPATVKKPATAKETQGTVSGSRKKIPLTAK